MIGHPLCVLCGKPANVVYVYKLTDGSEIEREALCTPHNGLEPKR